MMKLLRLSLPNYESRLCFLLLLLRLEKTNNYQWSFLLLRLGIVMMMMNRKSSKPVKRLERTKENRDIETQKETTKRRLSKK